MGVTCLLIGFLVESSFVTAAVLFVKYKVSWLTYASQEANVRTEPIDLVFMNFKFIPYTQKVFISTNFRHYC